METLYYKFNLEKYSTNLAYKDVGVVEIVSMTVGLLPHCCPTIKMRRTHRHNNFPVTEVLLTRV